MLVLSELQNLHDTLFSKWKSQSWCSMLQFECAMDPQAHVFEQVVLKCWHMLERLWALWDMGLSQWTKMTRIRSLILTLTSSLSSGPPVCYSNMSKPLRFHALALSGLLCHNVLYPLHDGFIKSPLRCPCQVFGKSNTQLVYSDVVRPAPLAIVLHNESANPSDTSTDPGNGTSGFDFGCLWSATPKWTDIWPSHSHLSFLTNMSQPGAQLVSSANLRGEGTH